MNDDHDGRIPRSVDEVLDIWESVLARVNPLPPEKRPIWREAASEAITPEAMAQFQQMSRVEIETMITDVLSNSLSAEARAAKEGSAR